MTELKMYELKRPDSLFVKHSKEDLEKLKSETHESDYEVDCPNCGAIAQGTGIFDGLGDLIKNKFVECHKCDWDQAS